MDTESNVRLWWRNERLATERFLGLHLRVFRWRFTLSLTRPPASR